MRVAFLTLGCKVNAYETEKMKRHFKEAGHIVVPFGEYADVYVINTCTVTNIADRKSRKMLHRARRLNAEAIVVAAGCYVDSAAKKGEVDDSVDLFLPNAKKENLLELVTEAAAAKKQCTTAELQGEEDGEQRSETTKGKKRNRAYLKVQNGCNQYCTYCIIPYVRGSLTSRPEQEIVDEVKALVQQGYQEVVVTGIHLSSYGVNSDSGSFLELQGKPLLSLLNAINGVEGLKRIRLGSLEPRIITPEFVKELAEIPKICPHFHLSLQSGCDTVLKRMNRHYTANNYLERVEILRQYFDYPAITTDIIVGFPQESQEEFETTCQFVRKVQFAQIHVFKYSRRQGTVADSMKGQIQDSVKAERSEQLLAIEEELENRYQSGFREEKVLLEEVTEIDDNSYLVGYNERYVRIGIPVENNTESLARCNTIVTVQILGHINKEVLLGKCKE